ncbi:MAG: hypothetical protein FJ087_01565 [Deltaproteobacteria bacterium]|nr:hypothetical protein [Deltaproteobacteria bacterium]
MVNGNDYDWESLEAAMPWGTAMKVTSIEYGDEKDLKPNYGKGSMPRGYGRGKYSAEGKMTVSLEEFDRCIALAKAQKVEGFFRIPPFPITCSYGNTDRRTRTDVLKQCLFKKRDFKRSEGDERAPVELEFLILGGIDTDGLPADTN